MGLKMTTLGGVLAAVAALSVIPTAVCDNSVEPDIIALMKKAHERRGAELKLFRNLALTGDLIAALPDYAAGNVPEFDSRWTQAQYRARLGRPLRKGEAKTLKEIRVLPYRIRSKASLVGQTRSSLAPGTRVFAVLGTLNSGRAVRASLDASALPDIEFGTPPLDPVGETRRIGSQR